VWQNAPLGVLSLSDKTGIELTGEIRRLLPETGIMIVSMHSKIKYIAEEFFISPKTVENHRTNIRDEAEITSPFVHLIFRPSPDRS